MNQGEQPLVMRILTRLGAGGPPIHAVLLTRELQRKGYRTMLVTGQCDPLDGDMSYLLRPSDSVYWISKLSRRVALFNDLHSLFRLTQLMRQLRPAIVHTHTAKAGVLGRVAACLAGVPVVVHTFHGNVLSGYFPNCLNWAIGRIERVCALASDAICVLSPQQADELAGKFRIAPQAKFRVVPLGMDLEPFRALHLPECGTGDLTVGWLGRLVAVKDIPLMLEVVENTLRASDRVRFLVAGDGPERDMVRSAAHRFGAERFEWLGWCNDVRPVIARCHVLLQTSKNEGTPVALIQGMAAGRPFVSTPAGGVRDMVVGRSRRSTAGATWFDNGVLAESNPHALARALGEFASCPETIRAMGENAQRFALRQFGLQRLIEDVDALYRELLGRKRIPQPVILSTAPSCSRG